MLELSNNNLALVGSCGITVLVHNNKIYMTNLGDSQAIIIT
jgi:serine/threonine protein phosphatase PrpC